MIPYATKLKRILIAIAIFFCNTGPIAARRGYDLKKQQESGIRERAWVVFLVAHARLVERIEASLAAADLPPLGWYDVLWPLEQAEGGRMRMYELAEQMVLPRSNLTRLADRLEAAQLIKREACPDDRRGAYCVITPEGRAMRARMWPVYHAAIDQLFSAHLNEAEADGMCGALTRIARAAKALPADAVEAKKRKPKPR